MNQPYQPRQDQIIATQPVNELTGIERQHFARRQGVSDTLLKLLSRAEGLDLLLAAEQVEETVEFIGALPDEPDVSQLFLRRVTTKRLYYPVPGYRSPALVR